MSAIPDYVPKHAPPKSRHQAPSTETCERCGHLKWAATKHADGTSYQDAAPWCLNCAACREARQT